MINPHTALPRFLAVHHIPGRIRLRARWPERCRAAIGVIARSLESLPEVRQVETNPVTGSLLIHYDPGRSRGFRRLLETHGEALGQFTFRLPWTRAGSADIRHAPWLHPLVLPTLSVLFAFGGPPLWILGASLAVWNALPVYRRACTVMLREQRLNIDFLDSLALCLVYAQRLWITGAFMVWLIELGDYVRDLTAAKFTRSIRELLDYQENLVWVVRDGVRGEIRARDIRVGETVLISRGCMIAVDGVVVEGSASVDERSITGESFPASRGPGDSVFAATLVMDGYLYLRAEQVGDDTVAAQVVRLVEAAPAGSTRIQNYAEKFADKLVAPSLAGSAALYLKSGDLRRFSSMVTVDFGTGIRVAAPTAILAAIAKAARHGVVIKSGAAIEKLAKADVIVFDKTGTLTTGEPQIAEPIRLAGSLEPADIFRLAAALEQGLKHPVADALVNAATDRQLTIPHGTDVQYEIGMGVTGTVDGAKVQLGSVRFLESAGIDCTAAAAQVLAESENGRSSLLLAVNGVLLGLIPFFDRIRIESAAVIRALRERGIARIIMITGDNSRVARAVSAALGLDEAHAELSPADKLAIVQKLQEEGHTVAMAGDGINDSAALSHADVGIAVKRSADIAQASASVMLMEETLWKLIPALEISREAIRLVKQNYAITASLNAVALAMAVPQGLSSPILTTAISNGSAIVACANAVRPLFQSTRATAAPEEQRPQ
jgi:heavy metal translocating P-type ATPase